MQKHFKKIQRQFQIFLSSPSVRKHRTKAQQYMRNFEDKLRSQQQFKQTNSNFTQYFERFNQGFRNMFKRLNLRHNKVTTGFDRVIGDFIAFLSYRGWDLPKFLVALNAGAYLAYLIWPGPRYNYYKHFSFINSNISHFHFHTCFTCHFGHDSFLMFMIDSFIMYLLAQNVMRMNGAMFLSYLCILSTLIGSILLAVKFSQSYQSRPYLGNDAIIRGLIFSIIFQQPTAKFYLLPFPFAITAWVIASVAIFLDLVSRNAAGFGGLIASYLLLNMK